MEKIGGEEKERERSIKLCSLGENIDLRIRKIGAQNLALTHLETEQNTREGYKKKKERQSFWLISASPE